ncbi:MAG: ABC transporter ATP-binding protein, partial [Luminiphilus sp.]
RENQRRKLSYREKTELAELPARIEALEQQQSQLQAKMAAADFYDQDPEVINEAMGALAQLTEDIDRAMERWAELED